MRQKWRWAVAKLQVYGKLPHLKRRLPNSKNLPVEVPVEFLDCSFGLST